MLRAFSKSLPFLLLYRGSTYPVTKCITIMIIIITINPFIYKSL